jgi:predicted nucleotidyltransferase
MKTVGIGGIVQAALSPLADRIRIAAIYGSTARSEEQRGSDVDLLIVGEATFAVVVSALHQAESTINREINPTVYSIGEFQSKISAGHHFLNTIVGKPMVFLIGDERELAKLAKKRLAH